MRQKEIVSANGCVLLYRSLLQMSQKLVLFELADIVIEDIPKNHNFLILHRLMKNHAKWPDIDRGIAGYLAQFPSNPSVLYELDTIKLSEFDVITNATDQYWCSIIDRLELFYKQNKR